MAFRRDFPCFVFVPQCPIKREWKDGILDELIKLIELLKSNHPIDSRRIYLVGYSMGGSGVFALTEKYYEFNGQLFAGLIRIAGQSNFDNRIYKILSHSSVWIHVGLQDSLLRVNRAKDAYASLKKLNMQLTEKIYFYKVDDNSVETHTLSLNGKERFKISLYSGVGHGIPHIPFEDKSVMRWLFTQESI